MGYTTVPTVATGDLWTAANHNTYIRDNFAAGVPDLFTAKGDSAWASAADTAAKLSVGTNKQAVFADSAQTPGVEWKWGDPYAHFIVTKSATQGSFSSGQNLITFDTEVLDPDGVFGSNKFTAPVAGLFYLNARINFTYTATFTQFENHWSLRKNGSSSGAIAGFRDWVISSGTDSRVTFLQLTAIASLAANDYVELYVNAGTSYATLNVYGGTVTSANGAYPSAFEGFLIR